MLKTFLSIVMLLAPGLAAQTATPQPPARKADNTASQQNAADDARRPNAQTSQAPAAAAPQSKTGAQRPGAAGDAGQEAVAAALQLAAPAARQKESLLADVRALEEESKELLKPLDAAAARAEIAAAAWTLDRDRAKQLLRAANARRTFSRG